MLTADALAHFGKRSAIARALQPDWTHAAVYLWDDVVPLSAARKLADLSGGELTVVESLYDSKGNIARPHGYVNPHKRKKRAKPNKSKRRRAA